jgi:hypothetical protein
MISFLVEDSVPYVGLNNFVSYFKPRKTLVQVQLSH